MADFIKHVACTECDSSDAGALYSDGSFHCHKCDAHKNNVETVEEEVQVLSSEFVKGDVTALVKRHINAETCRHFNYTVATYQGKPVQVANYYKNNRVVAQKLRFQDKTFTWIGSPKEAGMFGANLYGSGKRIIITEGEIDAMSMSQVQDNKWAVVSVKNGANGALKEIKEHLNYFNNFEQIVIMFDMDDTGQKAAQEIARILPIGKVSIAALPLKDANEMLVAGKVKELISAQWNAIPYRPDGIVSGDAIFDRIVNRKFETDFKYPWTELNKVTYGIRKGEIVLLTAGTGMGKSSIARQISYELLTANKKVGFISLEESVDFTALSLIGLKAGKRFHLDKSLQNNNEIKQHFDSLIADKGYFYDHFGSLDEDRLIEVIRYMALADECEYIFLDHISMACSGGNASDERAVIDKVMTSLRRVVEECNICVFVISHLRRLHADKGHEDGAEVSLSHLRGSGSLGQIPNIIIALQGSTSDESKEARQLKVLKNRFSGNVGLADELTFDKVTGHLKANPFMKSNSFNSDFEG